jgi:NAD+ synthase
MQISEDALALDYSKVESEILEFIKKVVSDANANGAVIGLSGGIDSSVVGALCVRALGKEKVVGILMPASHTPEQDVEDARALAKIWDIRSYEVQIDPIFSTFQESIPLKDGNRVVGANVKARTRMVINYFFANSLGMTVAGTGDRSEDTIGYFTKYGDGGVDFLPIAHLYKTQVRQLGAHLGLPERIVRKPASPQLWPGHRAADEIPAEYETLDLVLYGLFDKRLQPKEVAERCGVDFKIVEKVLRMHKESSHKRFYPPMLGSW